MRQNNPKSNTDQTGNTTNRAVIQMIQSENGTYVPRSQIYSERYVDWEDGMPVVRYKNVVRKEAINELTRHALSQPYEGEWDPVEKCFVIDPRFEGMTKAEVIEHRLVDKAAAGNVEAIKEIKDRLMGKPKQQVESKNLNISYEDYLTELARSEGMLDDEPSEESNDTYSYDYHEPLDL